MVGFKKTKQPVSESKPKSFSPQPVSESDPNKQQSTRDDAAVHRPSSSGNTSKDTTKLTADKVNPLLEQQQQMTDPNMSSSFGNAQTEQGGPNFWAKQNTFMQGDPNDNVTDFVMPWYTLPSSSAATRAANIAKAPSKTPNIGRLASVPRSQKSTADAIIEANSNPAGVKKTLTYFQKLMVELKTPKMAAVAVSSALIAALGTYPWSGHINTDNTIGGYSVAIRDARMAGDDEGADMLQAELDAFVNPELWGQIRRAVPFLNLQRAFQEATEMTMLTAEVNRNINDDEMAHMKEQTAYYDEQAALRREQEVSEREEDQADYAAAAQEEREAATSYYDFVNEKRKKEEEQAQIAEEAKYEAIRKANAEAEAEGRAATAAMYAKTLADRKAYDEEKRAADDAYWAKYWEEYEKRQNTQASSNSQLGFGLF